MNPSENQEKKVLPLQVKKPGNLKVIAIFVFLLGLAVINYFIFTGKTKNNKKQAEQENYQVPSLTTNINQQFAVKHNGLENPLQDVQLKLKQQIKEAKAKAFIERLEAPQSVEKENAHSQNERKKEPVSEVKLTDPNTAFLREVSNSKAEHVYATHYGPLPYLVGQGKFIFATLAQAINSDLPGEITAVVNQDVYGEQTRRVLIPRGSKLIGEYRSGLVNNQSRLFVVWTRIKEPNGIDIQIGSPGTDALGRAGLTGNVDSHYAARYLSATLIALIGAGASTIGVNNSDQYNSSAAYRQNVSQALSVEASNTLSQNLMIPPTIHVPQGEKIAVYVNRDLDFSGVYA